MASIDEAVSFIREFISREHQVEEAIWREPDHVRLSQRIEELNRDFHEPPMHSTLSRGPVDAAWLSANAEAQLGQLQPRVLFRVDGWEHPQLGDIHTADVSSTLKGDTFLFARYFIASRDPGLRLVALYHVCSECEGTGELNGRVCPECRGTGWNRRGGVEISDPGTHREERLFQEPTVE
jgi:hypothetical protein